MSFGAERIGFFNEHWSRYSLQSFYFKGKIKRISTAIGAKEEILAFLS
jgi:hypothetical protein